jgi:hypothetical protein
MNAHVKSLLAEGFGGLPVSIMASNARMRTGGI